MFSDFLGALLRRLLRKLARPLARSLARPPAVDRRKIATLRGKPFNPYLRVYVVGGDPITLVGLQR